MGIVYGGLEAESYDRTYGDRVLVQRILAYFRPYLRTMMLVAGTMVLSSLVRTGMPVLVAVGVDGIALARERHADIPSLLIAGIMGGVVVLGVLEWLLNYVHQWAGSRAVGDAVLTLRQDAFAAVASRDLSFYDQYESGKIVSRVTSDTQEFSTVVTLSMDVAGQILLALVMTLVLVFFEPMLTVITLAIAPFFVLVALAFRRVARWTSQRAQRVVAKVNAAIQETVSGIAVAKSFRQEAAIYADFDTTNKTSYRVRLQQGLVLNTIFPLLDILAGIGTALVVYFGGLRVVDGTVSIGAWYLFVRSLMVFYIPLIHVASFWSQFQQGLAASERVFALIDAEPKVVQYDAQPVPALAGHIVFAGVDFHYRDGEPVLDGFSLDIPAGQRVAIVGHTGAGKSSLVRLLTRFYEFQGGRILVDGRDIRAINLAEYRRQVGVVPQMPFLFSGTVAENIRYGRPEAGDAEVMRAAQAIGGGEWLEDLPGGVETDVGERGGSLSLGQRQLVALARVLLQDPSVFILDEATANIDPFTEAHIQEGLDLLMRERTSMVIAHRLSTVRSADRIIVMRSGRILEEGSHEGLLAAGGHYAELYTMYFRHQSLAYIEQVGGW